MTWTEAYAAYYRPLVRHVARVCPRDCEDIAQTAFLRVWIHRERYTLTYQLLCQVAKRLTLNSLRDLPPARFVELEAVLLLDERRSIEAVVIARSEVRHRLSGLSCKHRRALLLRSLGYGCPEVAGRLGVSRKAAANLITRGLSQARTTI